MPVTTATSLCGAKCRDGHACTQPAMPNGRCRMHSGKSPRGIASPHFKTGLRMRHESALPPRLLAIYQQGLTDPDLLAVKSEISLTDARLADLLGRVDTGEAGETWNSLRATYAAAQKALRSWNANGPTVDGEKAKVTFFEAVETIGVLIAEGAQDYQAWDEVHRMVEQRRRLAETETKRLEKMGQMITSERAMQMIAALVGLVREHVSDTRALAAISTGLNRLAVQADGTGNTP